MTRDGMVRWWEHAGGWLAELGGEAGKGGRVRCSDVCGAVAWVRAVG